MLQPGKVFEESVGPLLQRTGSVSVICPDTVLPIRARIEPTAPQNQADGVNEFVTAAVAVAAMGSWVGWILVKILWAPPLPFSPVPVEEGTA